MLWTRVKQILLLVLLAVDLFLAVNFGWKYFVDFSRTQQNMENIASLLSKQNVTIGEDFELPDTEYCPTLDIDRAVYQEELFSHGLLGTNATRNEYPTGIVEYTSPVGTVRWQANGAVQAMLKPVDYTAPQTGSSACTMARAMLESAGISVDFVWENVTPTRVEARFTTAGMPVFNRALAVHFAEDSVTISGWWTFDTPYTTQSDNQVTLLPMDAIFAFVALQPTKELLDMQAGYLLTQTMTSRLQLVPVWRIQTEQGMFYLDAVKYTLLEP